MLTHGSVSMVYDGDGNRVSETAGGVTTKYLIDSLNPTGYSQVLDELVSGSVTRTYAYGLQRISENQLVSSTWTPSFYGYDGHGNVRFLTSTTGAVGNTYQFDAFGMPIASAGTTANTYLYSGERFDQNIGLYHLRARYYNQNTGRFETMDPELGKSFNPATLHKYLYANANPTNRVDPLGLDAFEYATDLQVVFKTHGLDHLLAEGLELTQPEVEAYVEQLVREIIQEEGVSPGALIDIPFLMSQLGNVPWAARIFILTDALIEVTTYFPINK
jgi:RHS repeat-associated protein